MKYTTFKDPLYGNTTKFEDPEEEKAAIDEIDEIIASYGLTSYMLPPNIMVRGNQGDEPSYTRTVVLKGEFPGHEVLSALSTKISNRVPVNTVNFEIASSEPLA